MINSKFCVYCKKFLYEVATDYKISKLPIIIIDDQERPKWFVRAYKENKIKPYRGYPTFIIWDENEKYEIARIIGYRGKDRFYRELKDKLVNYVNGNKK